MWLGIFFILACIFDFGVTYYHYQTMPDFLDLEGNELIVEGLENGTPFFLLYSLIVVYIMIIVYFPLMNWLWESDNLLLLMFAWFIIIVYGIATVSHIYGGLSWFLW